MIRLTRAILLAFEGDALPTEFRLFTRGWNATENGRFLFDDKAAKSVMSAYQKWGVDLMIDLEHQSLKAPAGAADPTARDARGWCKLELRNGELWACSAKWTPDGEARLTEKRQRYVSPAFDADPKTGRILKMINVAITAIPATHKTPALVAASIKGTTTMDPKMVKAALEALQKGDDAAATEILKNMIASAASSGEGDADGSADGGAEGTAPPAETESTEDPKVVDASATSADDSDDEDDDKPAKKTERKAMRALLCRLTDSKTFADSLVKVGEFRTSHMTLETERVKLAVERATLESAERRQLVVSLVTLGAEFPATVWADDKSTTLKPRWLKMPIVELRSHVADQRKARGTKTETKTEIKPGVAGAGGSPETVTLSAEELAICDSMKCDPKDFASLKAFRDSKKGN